MYFCVVCNDKPNSQPLRLATREAHLAYLQESDCVMLAGPLLAEDDEGMIGSFLILNVADRAAAEAWAEADPYAQAELFERVEIHPWRKTLF